MRMEPSLPHNLSPRKPEIYSSCLLSEPGVHKLLAGVVLANGIPDNTALDQKMNLSSKNTQDELKGIKLSSLI